jgi:hypothetical protein
MTTTTPQEKNTWEERWQKGLTHWDLGGKHPELLRLVNDHQSPLYVSGDRHREIKRAFVPGCGSGYDVFTLCSIPGIKVVTGLDLSPTAIKRANELKILEGEPAVSIAEFIAANFFQFPDTVMKEKYDLCFDYTFLCALEPSDRKKWAHTYAKLLNPGGKLITFIFPLSKAPEMNLGPEDKGPPFKISLDLARELLEPLNFKCVYESPAKVSPQGRQGNEHVAIWQFE